MYNKLFTSILDSSIWLESTTTRLVWITLLAAMDEDGFVRMATVENLANRARVTIEEAETAAKALESPDLNCPEQEREGRRIERVDGGWLVLNSKKYRDIVNKEKMKEQTRLRVARYRAKLSGNAPVTVGNEKVTPSEAASASASASASVHPKAASRPVELKVKDALDIPPELHSPTFTASWQKWMTARRAHKKPKDWNVMFAEQLEWLKQFGPATATEILSNSIRNGYQGLIEPKGRPAKPEQKQIQEEIKVRML